MYLSTLTFTLFSKAILVSLVRYKGSKGHYEKVNITIELALLSLALKEVKLSIWTKSFITTKSKSIISLSYYSSLFSKKRAFSSKSD